MSDDLTTSAAIRAFAFSSDRATPAPATSAPTPRTAPATPVEPYSPVSPRYAAQWIEIEKDNLAKGKITPEEATRRFDALGATPEQRAPDTRSAYVKQLDAAFPPAKEHEFLVNLYPPGQAPVVIPKEVQTFEANVRAWMGPDGAGLSQGQGNSLVAIFSRAAQATQGLSANEREHYKDNENAKLDKLFGPDWYDQLKPAARMIHELDQKRPGLKDFIRAHGDNALFITHLIQAARIYDKRKGR